MAQPQSIQRTSYQHPLDAFFGANFLEDVPELQPDPVVESSGPGIGCEDPEPPAKDTFQPNDVF
jgi:hypothetical protein